MWLEGKVNLKKERKTGSQNRIDWKEQDRSQNAWVETWKLGGENLLNLLFSEDDHLLFLSEISSYAGSQVHEFNDFIHTESERYRQYLPPNRFSEG